MTGGRNANQSQNAQKGRVAAVVIAVGGLIAIVAPWLTDILGLPMRFEMLFYMLSLAAFFWAMVVLWQIRRAGREN